MTRQILTEIKPAEQAKQLGMTYLGFSGWGDPKTRQVLARTINGKLVRVGDEEDSSENLGRLVIIDIDDNLLFSEPTNLKGTTEKYVRLLKTLIHAGQPTVLMHARNAEERLAIFLKGVGITSGPTLVPIGSSDAEKKKQFVEKKVKEGYKEIQFFDRNPKAIQAVNALTATYNKSDVIINTHQIPPVSDADSKSPSSWGRNKEKSQLPPRETKEPTKDA